MVAGREKVGEGVIKMVRTQGESAIKPKPVEEKDTQKRRKNNSGERHKNTKYLHYFTGGRQRTIIERRRTTLINKLDKD